MTNCTQESFEYLRVNRRVAEASFDGGEILIRLLQAVIFNHSGAT